MFFTQNPRPTPRTTTTSKQLSSTTASDPIQMPQPKSLPLAAATSVMSLSTAGPSSIDSWTR
jgi:hypothetical protein